MCEKELKLKPNDAQRLTYYTDEIVLVSNSLMAPQATNTHSSNNKLIDVLCICNTPLHFYSTRYNTVTLQHSLVNQILDAV